MRRAQILTPADPPPDAARMRALGWDVEEELGPDITAPVVLESLEEAWREVRGGKSDDEDEGKDEMDLGEAAVSWRGCLLYTSPSPRDRQKSRMPSSA